MRDCCPALSVIRNFSGFGRARCLSRWRHDRFFTDSAWQSPVRFPKPDLSEASSCRHALRLCCQTKLAVKHQIQRRDCTPVTKATVRSEEHTSELQSRGHLV